ncbi:hypothetical protein LMG29542_07428 [Paraburkholderia humisilvae]|uniref:Uncharacterized protein n=1 Tax=Paraburkholderia humisilvae TaxID=627669 RepID=A0A6J5F946_9BURK|nr:hypothetical protein LMG29542_07428 [Paraburkholderia humisilvae]
MADVESVSGMGLRPAAAQIRTAWINGLLWKRSCPSRQACSMSLPVGTSDSDCACVSLRRPLHAMHLRNLSNGTLLTSE